MVDAVRTKEISKGKTWLERQRGMTAPPETGSRRGLRLNPRTAGAEVVAG